MSVRHKSMSSKKSQIKQIVRNNLPQAMLLIEKHHLAGKSSLVPGRAETANSAALQQARQLVVDLSIYAHLFMNVVSSAGRGSEKVYVQKNGQEFVDSLRRSVDDAFRQGYTIVVLVLDKQCHTTAAKENTQKARAQSALNECAALRCEPVDWDLDRLTALVVLDRPMLPMCAIKAVPAAFRYALWEAMEHIRAQFVPPPGCRLIVDCQAYEATNPLDPDDWLTGERITVYEAHRPLVDKLRERLASMAVFDPAGAWRHVARRLSTELGRAGAYQTLPWCLQTSADGVRLMPFILPGCGNTCGEADLAVWRWVQLLFADRQRQSFAAAERYTLAERKLYAGSPTEDEHDARGGRTVVATCDSDFIAGQAAAVGALLCDYAHGKPATYDTLDAIGAYCPLVLMGDTYAACAGCYAPDASVYGKESELRVHGGRALLKVYEFLDTFRFFCALLFDRYPVAQQPPPVVSALPLAPLVVTSTSAHQWFRRVMTFVTFCAIAGNDYLRGLDGMSHDPLWTALAGFTREGGELVMLSQAFVRPHDATRGSLPSQSALLVNPDAYAQFIKRCYHVTMQNKGGPNAPKCAPNQLTYAQLAALVSAKYKKNAEWHMPNQKRLELMYERTLWCVYYTLYGPNAVRRTLDETLLGWTPEARELIV